MENSTLLVGLEPTTPRLNAEFSNRWAIGERDPFQFPRPQLVVHAVYHQERCSRCGQLDVKYIGKVDISVDEIFLFKLFFLGLFSVCLHNIYFNILEYLSILDLLSFDQSDLQTLCYTKLYSISDTRPPAEVVEWGNVPLWAFFVFGHQRIILTGVLPIHRLSVIAKFRL